MSINENWIKKMWYIYTQWHITQPLKRMRLMPFAATWMDLEIVILSEVRQRKTNIIYALYVESKKNCTNELYLQNRSSPDGSVVKNLLGDSGDTRDTSSIPDWGIKTPHAAQCMPQGVAK